MITMFPKTLLLFLVFFLVSGASEAGASNWNEKYWKRMLPANPIPDVLIQLFRESPSATTEQIIAKNLYVIKDECPPKEKYDDPGNMDPIAQSIAVDEFFLEENLHSGMEIVFPKSDLSHIEFLSRQDVESLPFSTRNLPEFLTRFGVPQNSHKAKALNHTLQTCEAVESEKELCASSLEAMLKFVVSLLGHDARVYSSEKEDSTTGLRIYAREVVANDVLVCHKMMYPYAVYRCHSSTETIAYRLQLLGPKSEKATQIVVCHRNTSSWNAMHIAFEVLHVRRGEASVCHSTPIDTLVWGRALV